MSMAVKENIPSFRPLYQQVRESLVRRLIDGSWLPGMLLPSEFQLAAELGVSQGTVRKALDAMAAEHLLVRRQGRGTFVALPEESRILFQFFRLAADGGERLFPESKVLGLERGTPGADAAEALKLAEDQPAWTIRRIRHLGGRPVIAERIVLPADRFPGLDAIDPLPNNVYALYSEEYSIMIGRAAEKLKAVAADRRTASQLGCRTGDPLLLIERTAFALDGAPVEWRVSTCLTEGFHYRSELQ